MSQNSENNFIDRAPRFEVSNADEAAVSVTRTEQNDHEVLPAQLVDVSQHGVKLRVPVNMKFEEALQIKIDVETAGLEYHGIASVRHIRSIDGDSWLIGCAIAPPLSDETFSYLATTSGKERRQFRRMPIAAEGIVRRQDDNESVPATLHNLSSGGFCFISAAEYKIGECVELILEDKNGKPRVIESTICWQVDSHKGNIAGCQFISKSSYADLCECLAEQPITDPYHESGEVTSKLVLTAAVLAMFLPPMLTLFLQGNQVSAETTHDTQPTQMVAITAAITEKPATLELEETVMPSADVLQEVLPEVAPRASVTKEEPASREWLDNTGKHRTQAQVIDVTNKHIVLLKTNGRRSNVPWKRLSEADQEFAREWQAQRE